MIRFDFKRLSTALFASLVLAGGSTAFLPMSVAQAQVKGLPDFTELVEQVGPSVVNIRTLEKAAPRQVPGGQGDPDMLDFFRRFGLPIPNMPRQMPPGHGQTPDDAQPRGVGSGFVLTKDGMIMTNAHVVEGADEVMVTLTDKREFKAKIIGADKRTDVAVVKIEATDLPAVKVGDVSRLKVGEWVMAIGSPFGLENTVTAGIVSAKQRDTGDYLPFIQTDVAINPGNSGGPLINMRGEVVGINSQIYSRSGGSMGISFAIPMDEAVRVSEQLRSNGRVSRGRIGVQIEQVTKEIAEANGLAKPQGALVRGVENGAPADKAGIEAGDIITKFDGKTVEKSSDLPRMVGGVKPGTKSPITVLRQGKSKDLTVTIAEIEPDKTAEASTDKSNKGAEGGVQVESASGAAARAGLKDGDVILAVANTAVMTVAELESALGKLDKTKPLNILFRRGEWSQYTVIRPNR